MPRLRSVEELRQLKEEASKSSMIREATGTRFTVGLGTCGIAAGAREVMRAILEELDRRGIAVHVNAVGCVGLCAYEPLVDIEQAGKSKVTYGRISPEQVPRLIEEHLIKGRVIEEWVVARAALCEGDKPGSVTEK
ncbi:(2Fe-2S) ferredoxin domain-containing protein [Candidatus Hakubella thermalkaliphila]|uniref:NADP-reducing hydrogenase subunit HndB n=2 Tax=Candidatus Hakubella thermalkaliphila TaxID=2754717 RepID=A0A6V8Q6L5_9ACTN|nr:(2Fe-2S) ferredoxin domain-containing protein [Candidatus Hakubella thermalkaliphila]GFP40365.1 NADP-reducing hydrogenase subunit HndB [Candidatus Hakubella thermalkaliphila]